MTVAYCIAAYKPPSQCVRLVRRLLHDDAECRVFFHYDQRQSPLDLSQVASPRVRVVPERPIYWGSSQVVDLFVEMFRLALAEGCSYVVMLSGQDYPVRHLEGLEAELSSYDVWAEINPLFNDDGSCNWSEGRRRYSYRWWHADNPPRALRGAERVAAKVLPVSVSRDMPPLPYLVHYRQAGQLWWGARSRGPGMPIYTGSQWMSLSARAAEVICTCPRSVASFFHHVPVADEAFFHTILRNTAGLSLAPSNHRYIRWAEGESHPEVLTVSDLDSIVSSHAHFGRKFDEVIDSAVLDRLDALSCWSGSDEYEWGDRNALT